ncbi:MAG: hypothetical protein V5786_10475 [Psychromonas sp.]
MIIQTVNSEKGGREGNWIACLCALILLTGALLLPHNKEAHQDFSLAEHHVSINTLPVPSLSMIAELRLADEEIRYLYQSEQHWPSVTQLEESWVAPFVKDKSWLYQGEHHWSQVAPGIYQSKPAHEGPHYLLNSHKNELDIWVNFDDPLTLVNASSEQLTFLEVRGTEQLIESGWKKVIFESDESDAHSTH